MIILVVDKSGSMSGNPINQVKQALIHIVSMSNSNSNVKIQIIAYDSLATILNTNISLANTIQSINNIKADGGTNFMSAFEKIQNILYQ
jgi:uncharacterized protein YegL